MICDSYVLNVNLILTINITTLGKQLNDFKIPITAGDVQWRNLRYSFILWTSEHQEDRLSLRNDLKKYPYLKINIGSVQ